jgi:hypothetical protein
MKNVEVNYCFMFCTFIGNFQGVLVKQDFQLFPFATKLIHNTKTVLLKSPSPFHLHAFKCPRIIFVSKKHLARDHFVRSIFMYIENWGALVRYDPVADGNLGSFESIHFKPIFTSNACAISLLIPKHPPHTASIQFQS